MAPKPLPKALRKQLKQQQVPQHKQQQHQRLSLLLSHKLKLPPSHTAVRSTPQQRHQHPKRLAQNLKKDAYYYQVPKLKAPAMPANLALRQQRPQPAIPAQASPAIPPPTAPWLNQFKPMMP